MLRRNESGGLAHVGRPMKLVQEYLRRAEDCRKFALQTEIPDHRKASEERLKQIKEQNGRMPQA